MNRPRDHNLGDFPHALEQEYDAETPASVATVQAICALEDIDPMQFPAEFGFVLRNHVDSTALDRMVADGTGDGNTVVSFEVTAESTYLVEVSNDGRIAIHHDM